ncbi:glycosyltransferase family 2 protein [Arthrobacter sp. H35-D1]|nr:glycosyltransferase family 2 protein [Arthrobacter sp. H35-D1]MDJ0312397.1 glycosyltransferase family 2 protein [Arthrobacter sp. H35-D1]
MVAHNGGAYLPTVLAALASQTRPADVVLAADTGSTDDSGELLRKELGERKVISLDGRQGYGAAVDAVLEHQSRLPSDATVAARPGAIGGVGVLDDAGTGDEGDGSSPACNEWIWLLQDDAAPAPETLQRLLDATERATTATVVGCKQLDWDNHRRLVDVGLWANKWFDRFVLIGLDEQDQGQYDSRSDVFAVNSAGMLVRRDVFEKLDGFDPALPGTGDDLDFCARVRLAGDRVLVVPDARMFHVVHRPHGMGSAVAARKAAIFMRLKHAPAWAVPFQAIGTFLAAIYWLAAGFVLKAPGHAVRMFAATCAGLVRPGSLHRSRKALAAQRRKPRSVHKGVLVENRAVRDQLKILRETIGPDEELPQEILGGPAIVEPTGETHQESVAPLAALKTAPIVSALALAVLLSVFSLFALSRFLGVPALAGGALLPVSAELGSVWQHATDWWVSLGSGLPGHGNPFNVVLAALSALGGNGSQSVLWLMLLALPLSGFTAWLAAGALSRRRWIRVVAGLAWAGAPMLLAAMGQGRVGALLVHVLLPLVMLGLIRAVGAAVGPEQRSVPVPGAVAGSTTTSIAKLGRTGVDGNPSWTAAAAAGLALAAVTAAAPSLLPVAVVGILFTAVFMGRRGKTIWWALVPPVALFLPFAWSVWANPRALLADPGLPLASHPGPLWQQLLGFPEQLGAAGELSGLGAFTSPSWWLWVVAIFIGAPVVLAAAAALVLPLRRAGTVRALWLVALLALAATYAGKFIAVAFDGATLVTPFSGPALSLAFFALLGAALLGFDAVYRRAYSPQPKIRDSAGRQRHRVARTMAITMSVVLVAAPLASLGLWGAQQLSTNQQGPALTGAFLPQAVTAGTIPATAADRGAGPEASRTIVLAVMPDGGVHATLMQGAGTTLDATSGIAAAARITGAPGSETLLEADPATVALQDSVAAMLSKSGIDPRPGLVDLGVGFVVLRQGDTAAELLAGELEAVPGLDTVGPTESGWLWRVKPNYAGEGLSDVVNRVRIVDAKGNSVAPVDSQGQDVDTMIGEGADGRSVELAERSDAGWKAWLDGTPLKAVSSGWTQTFELPAAGGKLEIRYVHPLNTVLGLVQLILFGLTVLLALPVRARRGRTGAYRDEASLQKVGRSA